MNYNFVEIGCCDFDIVEQDGPGIRIEPIYEYLDKIPEKPGVTKLCAAITNLTGRSTIYLLTEEQLKGKPDWLRGCSSINQIHPEIKRLGLKPQQRGVVSLMPHDLVEMFNIESIGFLKIDTEGWDQYILKQFITMGIDIGEIQFEHKYFGGQIILTGWEQTKRDHSNTWIKRKHGSTITIG